MTDLVKKLFDDIDHSYVRERHGIEQSLKFWTNTPFTDKRQECQTILLELLQCNSNTLYKLFNGYEMNIVMHRDDVYTWNFILNYLEEHVENEAYLILDVDEHNCKHLKMSMVDKSDFNSIVNFIRETRIQDEIESDSF